MAANGVNEPHVAPRPLLIVDGKEQKTIDGAAAAMIRMIAEQAAFFNAPYNTGVIHFHFSGNGQAANIKSDVTPALELA